MLNNNLRMKTMDLATLIQARKEMMNNDFPLCSTGIHGTTKEEVIKEAIEFLNRELLVKDEEPSENGYRISVEIFKKGNS